VALDTRLVQHILDREQEDQPQEIGSKGRGLEGETGTSARPDMGKQVDGFSSAAVPVVGVERDMGHTAVESQQG
jgi:hypothetical protein